MRRAAQLLLWLGLGLSTEACSRLFDSGDLVGSGTTSSDAGLASDAGLPPDGSSPQGCADPGLIECLDFEQRFLPRPPWFVGAERGTARTDSSRAHRGLSSLKFHLDAVAAGVDSAGLLLRGDLPTTGTVAVRAFFYFDGWAPTSGALLALTGGEEPQHVIGLGAVSDGIGSLNTLIEPDPEYSKSSSLPIPRDRWVCLEIVIELNEGKGSERYFLDGLELGMLGRTVVTQTKPALNLLFLGSFPIDGLAIAARDFWIDDVAISTTRIGCDR